MDHTSISDNVPTFSNNRVTLSNQLVDVALPQHCTPMYRLSGPRRPTHPNFLPSVRGSISERSSSDADTLFVSIIHGVEPLKPCLAVDEIETLARIGRQIADDEVDAANYATNRGVQRPRPELCVGRELEFGLRTSNQLCRTKKFKRWCSNDSHRRW